MPPRGGPRCSRSSSASLAADLWGGCAWPSLGRADGVGRSKRGERKATDRSKKATDRSKGILPSSKPRQPCLVSSGRFAARSPLKPPAAPDRPRPARPAHKKSNTSIQRHCSSSIRESTDRGRTIQGPTAAIGDRTPPARGRARVVEHSARRHDHRGMLAARSRVDGNPDGPQDRLLETIGIIHTAQRKHFHYRGGGGGVREG